ncbi:MAG TPA: TIGR00730 family Rossman fold protein [Victivallales bacterium]|nr:TIGR00730 family Rossman fold protein [Victivallales bacterium]
MLSKICVFCGSSPGTRIEYKENAVKLGQALAEQNINLIYGGSNVGLMGVIAKTVLKHGGKVTGVMPRHLVDKEVAFNDLEDLRIVDTMHERKALMENLSDGFIAMPGGFGTFEEIFEMITWSQLDLHQKPCGFLNISGFYDKLISFINHAITEGFIHESLKEAINTGSTPLELINKLKKSKPIIIDKAQWAMKLKS